MALLTDSVEVPFHEYEGHTDYCQAKVLDGMMCGFIVDASCHARPKRESVLVEAEKIINGARREAYGGPLESFTKIGKLWEQVLGFPVSAEQVALCLNQLKVARAVNNLAALGHVERDSIVDMAGYAGCLEKVAIEREQQDNPLQEMPGG